MDIQRFREGARVLVLLGDSVTTDHISPVSAIRPDSEAGRYLTRLGVPAAQLSSLGARRGNHEVMVRSIFTNRRLSNYLVPGEPGGVTRCFVDGQVKSVYEAAQEYAAHGVPLVVVAGSEYGTGSSRDWAAKGTALLGVRAVIARGFERIHRSNLIGMGILPLQFPDGVSAGTLGLTGEETFSIRGLGECGDRIPRRATASADGRDFACLVRLDTPTEEKYYRHGGILRYVARDLLRPAA